ncbi:MAG: RNA methyltransferase, partial [Verrucomicrobiota bacterium]
KQVADLFQRIGGFSTQVVEPVVACPQPYGYRNRIMVRSQWDKFKQGLNIGYIRYDNRLVVDIERCLIAEPALNEQLTQVRAHPPPKGGLKVVLRVMPEGWQVPKDSFFQNNFYLLPALIETVRNCLRGSGVRHLIDMYCGVGFFSLELGDLVDSYAGVELDKPAVLAARQNAVAKGRTNGEFILGDAQALLPQLLRRFAPGRTAVVLDPPRTGCPSKSLELLREVTPRQIIYVSCHPATLARDLNVLCRDGVYDLVRITPLDMFPQTQHVECVADVRLRAAVAESE